MAAAKEFPYRPDIDGLRAVSVLAVFAFHLGLYSFARGGFIGVDVFFVISGYLITGIIRREIEAEVFSIATFYRRRVLRILPAFLVMLAGTAITSLVLLPPVEVEALGRAIVSAALSVSNILFYVLPGGYFFNELSAKPLLHTWSLGVEEQFYFIFPLLLLAGYKLARRHLQLVIAVLGIASFAVSVSTLRSDPSGAFFLLPARFWELMIGAAAALGMLKIPDGRWWREGLAILGAAVMAWSLIFTDGAYPPIYWALLPCLGATLLLITGDGPLTIVGRILALKPLVWVGLISYSLYLWHWPVIVLTRLGLLQPLTMTNRVIILAIAFVLAIASWWFVERPFRRIPKAVSNSKVLVPAAIAIAISTAVGFIFVMSNGFPARFSAEAVAVAQFLAPNPANDFRSGKCFIQASGERYDWDTCMGLETGKPRVILFGDSHAADLWPGLVQHAARLDIRQVTATYCPGLVGTYQTGMPFCSELMGRFFNTYLSGKHPQDTILFSERWRIAQTSEIRETIRAFQATGARVILIGPMPEFRMAVPRLQFVGLVRGDPDLVDRAQDMTLHKTEVNLRALAVAERTQYVSLIDALCDERTCRGYAEPGVPMMIDTDHLSSAGARIVAPLLLTAINDRP